MGIQIKGLCFLLLSLGIAGCTEDTVDFDLTIRTVGSGTVKQEKLDREGTWKLTAEAGENYNFSNWSGDVNGTDNPIVITLDEDKVITATFEVNDLLAVEVSEGGSYEKKIVSSENGVIVYDLKAIPAPGFEFVGWNHGEKEYFSTNITLEIAEETVIGLNFTDTSLPFEYNKASIVNLDNEIIWGLDAITNEHILFTTKSGKIFAFKGGQSTMISNYYEDLVNSSGQGGLLDLKLDPNYEQNNYVYVTYSQKIPGSNFSYLSLDRFIYDNGQISGMETIFQSGTPSQRNGHFGSRIAFSDEYLFVSIGEGSPSKGGIDSRYQNAQDLTNDWGKIHRLNFDGSIPADNPFHNSENSRKSIYSYGHRNPQGLMFDPYDVSIISSEHGPKGGDELNVIKKGVNYGWPLVSYGVNYDGSAISGGSHEGYEKPIFYWDPSIATSQLVLLKDKKHKAWFRNILVAGLKSKSIYRLRLQNGIWQEVERIQLGFRVRSICAGENGLFFVSGDNGVIVRFSPVD